MLTTSSAQKRTRKTARRPLRQPIRRIISDIKTTARRKYSGRVAGLTVLANVELHIAVMQTVIGHIILPRLVRKALSVDVPDHSVATAAILVDL